MANKKSKISAVPENLSLSHYEVDIYWSAEDGVYVAKVPELPGCMTHGTTRAQAAKNAEEAITLYIQTLTDRGIKAPVPLADRSFSGNFPVRTDPQTHRDLMIKAQMEKKSLNEYVIEKLKKAR
jgi:predicted RNase H-like HicB family nuclease